MSFASQLNNGYPTKPPGKFFAMSNPATASLRAIPSVDQLLRSDAAIELRPAVGVQRLTVIAREITDQMRAQIESGTLTGRSKEALLVQLTGAEAALIVNNCASAALLILTVLAHDGETIVSRGELVEIGGDFRVPDVMSNSGTRMIEVGSTNRTRLDDYQRAINDNTRLIMRVHPSNYRIVGFTAAVELAQLASLAHESGLLLYEDAGSGVLNDLSQYGLDDEPVISESISAGADVVSFSGDKLLGATQAGLIVGRREIVDLLRKHSLYRALRVDKLC